MSGFYFSDSHLGHSSRLCLCLLSCSAGAPSLCSWTGTYGHTEPFALHPGEEVRVAVAGEGDEGTAGGGHRYMATPAGWCLGKPVWTVATAPRHSTDRAEQILQSAKSSEVAVRAQKAEFMTTDTGLEVVRPACVYQQPTPCALPHVHRVIWFRVIGSVVIIALWGAVLLLQPGGLKREELH